MSVHHLPKLPAEERPQRTVRLVLRGGTQVLQSYEERGEPMVTRCGRICLGAIKINVGQVLARQAVGTKEVHDDIWLVSVMDEVLSMSPGWTREAWRARRESNPRPGA
jgi:hypothetical protein